VTKEAKPDAWMPLFIGDYHKDTGRLTTEQHGAYLLLIMEYWTTGPLADDDDELSAITRTGKEWKRLRPKMVRFFQIDGGVWRHKRIDEELAKWAERKLKAVERARKGGQAKAASSTNTAASSSASSSFPSTQQAVLKGCSSSSSTEVGGPKEPPTLSKRERSDARQEGASPRRAWQGPEAVREAFVLAKGEDWTATYLDPCQWQDVPERALIPATGVAGAKISREARRVLTAEGLVLLERVA
jgi:uncharacterized protein YdaU (DUF1376 family)